MEGGRESAAGQASVLCWAICQTYCRSLSGNAAVSVHYLLFELSAIDTRSPLVVVSGSEEELKVERLLLQDKEMVVFYKQWQMRTGQYIHCNNHCSKHKFSYSTDSSHILLLH